MSKISLAANLLRQKFTPVKKNKWVFTSFSGHYSDSPKYISEKLYEIDKSAEIVWLVKKKNLNQLPSYVTGVDIDSTEAGKHRANAQILIDNVYADMAYTVFGAGIMKKLKSLFYAFCYNKKNRYIFTTWHGTPLKKMGRDQLGNNVTDFVCSRMTMLLGNRFTIDKMKHLTFDKINMEILGTPRNDLLFSNEDNLYKIKSKLGLPTDKKIILFAPTFRNDGNDVNGKNVERSGLNQLKEINFSQLFNVLNRVFGGEWVFVCRFHYHVEAAVNWEHLDLKYNNRIINGNIHDDMAEYLACSDVLITDASSCMFDFALTGKPCFIYFPDIRHYAEVERGFYVSVESLPFPSATTFSGLYNAIEVFDKNKYNHAVREMLDDFGYVDDSNSSQRIVEYILKQCKK